MADIQKQAQTQFIPIEKGYRPTGKLDTRNPPKGGSGVPAKPTPQQNSGTK